MGDVLRGRGGEACCKQGSIMRDIHTCPGAGPDYTQITTNQLVECSYSEFNSIQIIGNFPLLDMSGLSNHWCVAGEGEMLVSRCWSIISRCGLTSRGNRGRPRFAARSCEMGFVLYYCWCYEGYIRLMLQLSGKGQTWTQHSIFVQYLK